MSIAEAEEKARALAQALRKYEGDLTVTEREGRKLRDLVKSLDLSLTEKATQVEAMTASLSEERWLTLRDAALTAVRQLLDERDRERLTHGADLLCLRQSLAEAENAQQALRKEVVALKGAVNEREDSISEREGTIRALSDQLTAVKTSSSWRLTEPLRYIAAMIRSRRTSARPHAETKPTEPWQASIAPISAGSPAPCETEIGDKVESPDSETSWIAPTLKADFDVEFYLKEYPDVARAGVDPIVHYLNWGAAELRNPSPEFSTKFYLDAYPDVRALGVNPFVHFIRAGRQEGRLAQRAGGFKARYLERLRPFTETGSGPLPETDLLKPESLLPVLQKALRSKDRAVISISHDNYTSSVGGVQLCLMVEEMRFLSQGAVYINLHPVIPRAALAPRDNGDKTLLNIVIDGDLAGAARARDIESCLEQFGDGVAFTLAIHALHGHSPETVIRLAQAARARKAFFWVHDYLSICPGYNLLRNGISFCGAPPTDSTACTVCVYGESRADHVSRIYNMFSAIPFTVLAPSVSALEIWKQRAGLPNKGTMVLPHCRLETDSNGLLQAAHEGPIRIAFLSYPTVHKGWPVFEELVDRLADNPHFEFHYLGKNAPDGPRSSRLKFTRVEVTPDNRQAMSQAIHSARINFAILWSIAPETFGFTSLEAVAGGATVLTFRGAGNIARLVTENGIGRVFDSEAELFSFFESGEAAREAAKGRLAGRRITYNGMTAEAVDRGV